MRRLAALLLLFACTLTHAQDTLRIGSKRFTESYILAHVLAQTAAPALPSPPQVREGLGLAAEACRRRSRHRLWRHRREADRRDGHLHHRREDRAARPVRAGGRQALLPALRRARAVSARSAEEVPAGVGGDAKARRPH